MKEDGGSLWRLPLGWHMMTYISLERSRRVEQLCPLCQSDLWTTGGARGRQSRNFFRGFFHFGGVLIVNWPSEIDLSRSRIDRINSLRDMIILKISFVIVWYGADSSSTTALRPTNSNCEYRGLDDSAMMHHYPAVTLFQPRGCRVFCNTYKIIMWWNYNQFDLTLRLTNERN